VALCRALLNRLVILADEPTGNLDRVAAEEVLAALSETSDGGCGGDLYHDPVVVDRCDAVLAL